VKQLTDKESSGRPDERSFDQIFSDALSYIPTHNHLVQAYHQVDMYDLAPHHDLRWKVHPIFVPEEVRNAVDSDTVISKVKAEIVKARAAIEAARPSIDHEVERLISHSPDRPYENLLEQVTVVHHVKPGYASAWRYTFNPYLLAKSTLDKYEFVIDRVARRRPLPFSRVAYTCEEAKWLANNTRLVERELQEHRFR
jgi:hypothetical protein